MNILIDLSYFNPNASTGVSIYAERLIQGLEVFEDLQIFLLGNSYNHLYIKSLFPQYDIFKIDNINKSKKLFKTSYKKLEDYCIEKDIKLFFIPYLTLWSLTCTQIPNIAVLHDMQPFILNSYIKNFIYKRLLQHKIKEINTIVAISNYTKEEIIKRFPKDVNNINVIYNSIIKSTPKSFKLPTQEPYILNINTITEYKNPITLIKAFNLIKDKIPHVLIFKGKKNEYWNNKIAPFIRENKLEDRVFLISQNLSESEIAYLYTNADIFINPSLMEGFGFTPIEAALYGIPVITTKRTALEETTLGILNYYTNPKCEKELSLKIIEILNNYPDKQTLTSISSTFENYYSVEKQAQSFHKLFKSII